MPPQEIATILGTAEPLMVHRYLELHWERLEEQLGEQRRTLGRLEELLTARSIEATALSLETRGRSTRVDLSTARPGVKRVLERGGTQWPSKT